MQYHWTCNRYQQFPPIRDPSLAYNSPQIIWDSVCQLRKKKTKKQKPEKTPSTEIAAMSPHQTHIKPVAECFRES